MSLLGYNPKVYYKGRAAIEAVSMDIPIAENEVIFRCNLVSVEDNKMKSYCAGHISTYEAKELIGVLNEELGGDDINFYTGVSYRHLLKLKGHENTLEAICTPPHDIPDKPITKFLPSGKNSHFLRQLMHASGVVLEKHPVNIERMVRGDMQANMVWLFWGSGQIPNMPTFKQVYGFSAALTSGVDLLLGLGLMMGMDILKIEGITDGLDNDFREQAVGALKSLENHDLVVIHIEAPDEAGHAGSVNDKIAAIQRIDRDVVSQLRAFEPGNLRLLVMPDHPTPIEVKTHIAEPVPFILWGPDFIVNCAERFTEAEAKRTGLFVQNGYNIMGRLLGRK
jgi:2,3-bisphosphoglycerate-independent phosphoglycerate mutase